jgi:N-methylhydantoinase B
MLEREYPIVLEGFGLVRDSAGAGKYRGSVAVYRQWRFLQDGHIMVRTIRPGRATDGLNGGGSGSLASTILNPGPAELVLPAQSHLHLDVKAGDRLLHTTPGAGGHGDPLERPIEKVLEDVREEKVSIAQARDVYGVVMQEVGLVADQRATRASRESKRIAKQK